MGRSESSAKIIDAFNGDCALANCRRQEVKGGTRITRGLGRRRQRLAVGLRDVEHIRRTEAMHRAGLLVGCVVSFAADDRRENRDALPAFTNAPTERAPRLKSGDSRGRRTLTGNQTHVVPEYLWKRDM